MKVSYILFTLAVLMSMSINLKAQTFKNGELWFEIQDNQNFVFVTESQDKQPSGKITIPSYVVEDGKKYVVKGIDYLAFERCDEITEIELPETIEKLCSFDDCKNLKKIIFKNPSPVEDTSSLEDQLPEYCVVYVPKGSSKDYYLASGYPYIVEGDGSINCITRFQKDGFNYAFINYYEPKVKIISLDSDSKYEGVVKIPATVNYKDTEFLVEEIDKWAFLDCSNLEQIIFSDEDYMPNVNLKGCNSLKKISVGPKTHSFFIEGFDTLDSLEEIEIKTPNPPKTGLLTDFTERIYENCTLVIPKGAINNYRVPSTEIFGNQWSKFKNIIER